jgi:methylmalonyl-CoA/ethylmalonyl-CoA epimerase
VVAEELRSRMPGTKDWTISLDHVAVAAADMQQFLTVMRLLGLDVDNVEIVQGQKVRTHFIHPSSLPTTVEVLEPLANDGPIAKYLASRGSGIHHISFLVSDLDAAERALRSAGVRLVYDTPSAGAHGTRVNFIHPASAGGILIEISQKARE